MEKQQLTSKIDKALASLRRPTGLNERYAECLREAEECHALVTSLAEPLKSLIASDESLGSDARAKQYVHLFDAGCGKVLELYTQLKKHNDAKHHQVAEVDKFVQQTIDNSPGRRTQLLRDLDRVISALDVKAVSDIKEDVQEVHGDLKPLEGRIESIQNLQESRDEYNELTSSLEEQLVAINRQKKEIDTTLSKVTTLLGAAEAFDGLADRNFWAARMWCGSFIIALVSAVSLASLLFLDDDEWKLKSLGTGAEAITSVLQRGILLAIPLAIMKITLTKFNSCLHLRTIYLHRLAALKHYGDFEATIPEEETTIKSQLRLELGKLIFADPATGMIKNTETDININPLFTTLGKVVKPPSS